MKKKQLKKRMKAKKRLTSAAVALLMSGSLLPVGNVFANEQSTQENSISSAEAKADLEKGMAVSGVENSTEAKQETQNTEKTSENSEDDKISIPETARDSKEATKSSTQDTSSELPEGLRNVKSTRLSDGRIAVDISTSDQLQEAFNNAAIGQVNLVNNITLTKQINMYSSKNPKLVINGNNHTIDLQKFSFWGDDSDSGINVKLVNLTTLNGGGWGAFDSPSASVEVENVTHRGETYLVANQIKLSGKVNIQVVQQPGGGYNSAISSYWRMDNAKLTISSGADVTVNHAVTTGTPSSVLYVNQVSVEPNAKFTVTSPYTQPWGVIRVAYNGGINVGENAQLNVNSSEANTLGIDFRDSASSLNVARGGSLSVSSAGNYAIGMYPGNSKLNLSGAKFNIQSTKSNGLPLYMGSGGSVTFDKQNVRAWLKGFATATDPQYSWDNVTGVVNMSGANTTSALSNNTEFNALFKNQNFSRISSNGRAIQELTKTTINEVKDTDTTVSGKGEPNGKIELKVGDQVIASGTVGSDGNYSLTIPKQNAGTVIKAVVSMDGQTSEANTTVVRTALAQTTISEINTETTQVSGKGEPNAPIKIMNGDQIIAQGVIGSDGNYILTIPRQAKDSVIKAIVEKDGLTSEAQTTVKQGSLAQTTISEINTETTQVSGKGEPNAPIKIMNGDQIIAQGVIGSDGNYTLTIPKQAKDSVIKAIVEKDGLTSKAQTTVTQGSLVQTTISNIDTNTTSVSGKGEPNAKIELKVGNQVIASGRIGSDGNYSLTIPKQSVGTVVKAVVSANGLTSEAHTTVTRADLAPTTISKVDSQTTVITGTGEPGGKIELLNGNQLIAQGYVGQDGHYSLTVMKQPAGSTIVAKVTMDGKESQASTVVEEKINLQAPVIDKFTEGDAYAKGNIAGDAKKVAIFVNGVQRRVVAVSNGKYSIYAGDLGLKAGDKFEIAGIAGNGTIGPKTSATVQKNPVLELTTTIDKFTEGDAYAKGTAGKDATKVAIFVNGVQRRVVAVSNGRYSIYAGDLGLKAGDKFEIAGIAGNGTIGPKTSATVQKNPVLELTTTIDKFTEGDAYAKGTAGKDATKVAIFVNGVQRRVVAVSNGRYSIYAGDLGLKAGDKFEIAGIAGNGTIGPKTSATVQKNPVLELTTTIDKFTEGDAYAKGTAGKDATKVAIFVNGVQRRVAAVSNGKYSIYAGDLGLKAGDKFEIAGIAADGTVGPKISTTVQGKQHNLQAPTIDPYYAVDSYAKGTAGKDATKVAIFVNGVQRRVAAVSNGKYSIYAGDLGLKAGDKFEIAGIAADGTIGPKTSATVLENNPEKYGVTAENYILGSNTINGTAKSGIARVKLFVNGHVVRQTAVENGEYSIWASDVVTSIGDKVEIIGMDANGVERSRVTVTIMNAPVEEMTLTVNEYTFGENNITGTKSANVSRVQLFVNGVMKRTAVLNGNNFEVYAKDVIVSASDKVEIVGFDKYGNEKRVPVTIKEKEPEKIDLTVNPYKLGDGSITGTVSENVSYVTLNQGANVLKRGEVKGSNFSIWAQGIVTETPGNYTIVAHTASGETKEVPLVVNP